MKSLVFFTYKQPHKNLPSLRFGVLEAKRDTNKNPLALSAYDKYRSGDPRFQRTRKLYTVLDYTGFKQYYRERMGFYFAIPVVGSIVKWTFFKRP